MSIALSIPEGEGGENRVMRRVPSNSSYLNKINHSGLNMKQALVASNEAAVAKAVKSNENLLLQASSRSAVVNSGSNNTNIY